MIRNTTSSILFLIALSISFSGCLDRDLDNSSNNSEWLRMGLGLEIPEVLPPPGPFAEGDELLLLESFLLEEGREILTDCGDSDGADRIAEYLQEENYYDAIGVLVRGCTTEKFRATVDHSMQDNTEEQAYKDLMENATAAVDEVRRHLDDHPGPGNKVEVTLIARLMSRTISEQLTIEHSAPNLWEAYENGTARDDLQLRNAFLNLARPVERANTLLEVLNRYPWSEQPCVVPDIDEMVNRTQANFDHSLDMAHSYGHDQPGETGFANGIYIHLNDRLRPDFEIAQQNRWWPRLWFMEVSSEIRVDYWESFSVPAWPTMEEAEFMLAQNRNESRTIWTEGLLGRYHEYFNSDWDQKHHDWDSDIEFGPPNFLARLSAQVPFHELDCPAESR